MQIVEVQVIQFRAPDGVLPGRTEVVPAPGAEDQAAALRATMRRLGPLRDEARTVADLPSVTREQVDDWRNRTSVAIGELYGPDSEPARECSRIRFDYTDVIESAERVIRAAATEQDVGCD